MAKVGRIRARDVGALARYRGRALSRGKMPGVKRRIFNLLAAMSLAMFVAAVVQWIRSSGSEEIFAYSHRVIRDETVSSWRRCSLFSMNGRCALWLDTWTFES